MSIKVMSRVWETAEHKGGALLLLLALADHANDQGICWPGQDALARKARMTARQVINCMHELIESGDIYTIPGRGRGVKTMYAVLTGLSDSEQEKVKSFLRNNFTEKFSSEISDIKKVKFLQKDKGRSDAPESGKTAQKPKANHHENRHDHESIPSSPSDPAGGGDEHRKRRAAKPPPHVAYLLDQGMGAASEFADLDPDAAIADFKRHIQAGHTIAQVVRAWRAKAPQPIVKNGTGPPARPDRPLDTLSTDETARRLAAMQRKERT